MTDPLLIAKNFKTYIHHMIQSATEEKQAIAALIRIYGDNNEVNTNAEKLSQCNDRLDKKLEAYTAQRRLLDELENAINYIEQEQEKEQNKWKNYYR